MDRIAKWYGEWMKSRPFDMGITTRNALNRLKTNPKAAIAYKDAFNEN